MISKEEFKTKCDDLTTPKDFENYKKDKKKLILPFLFIQLPFILVYVIIATTLLPAHRDNKTIVSLVIVLGVLLLISITISLIKFFKSTDYNFKNGYKTECIDYIHFLLETLLEGYTYNYNNSSFVPQKFFNKTPYGKPNQTYESYCGEDLLKIKLPSNEQSQDVEFQISDLLITKKMLDKNIIATIFNGCFGYFECNKDFKCVLGINHKPNGTEKFELEDINFNKDFDVYTDNQIEALMILTPKLMENLKSFKNRFGDFTMDFKDNCCAFTFKRNILEVNLNVPKAEFFDTFYDDIELILSIVNEIKNNNKIFKI